MKIKIDISIIEPSKRFEMAVRQLLKDEFKKGTDIVFSQIYTVVDTDLQMAVAFVEASINGCSFTIAQPIPDKLQRAIVNAKTVLSISNARKKILLYVLEAKRGNIRDLMIDNICCI